VSLDYPYFGLHDAADCYRGIGWTLMETRLCEAPAHVKSPDPGDSFVVIRMEQSLHGEAWLLFSTIDTRGRTWVRSRVGEERTLRQRLFDRVNYVLHRQSERSSPDRNPAIELASAGPWYQIHVIGRAARPLSTEQQNLLQNLYVAAREKLRERCRRSLEGP
jgi:hypothetical protein